MAQENRLKPHECMVLDEHTPINSEMIFRYSNVVVIQHHGECYRLRCTRQGKLILTK